MYLYCVAMGMPTNSICYTISVSVSVSVSVSPSLSLSLSLYIYTYIIHIPIIKRQLSACFVASC